MLAVLQWIYGPNAGSDPYYQLMHDILTVLPWWYPYMWLTILGSVVAWRLARRLRRGRQNRIGLRRVRARVRALAERPQDAARLPRAANDDMPPLALRRLAAE